MPSVRIDWATIKEKLGDVTAVYLLTHRQASLILSNIESLEWKATYRDFDYDYSDYDELQLEVADLHHNLTMPVNIADIIPYIDEIETLLRSLQGLGVCCDDVRPIAEKYRSPLIDDWPTTPPETWGGETVADADDWFDLVCGAANNYVDTLKDANNEVERLVTYAALGVGAVAGLLTLLAGAGLILPIAYGVAAALTTTLIGGATAATFSGVDEDLEENRGAIVCAILNGTLSDVEQAIRDAVGELAWGLFYSWIDLENAYNVIISGTNGQDNLPILRGSENCECDQLSDGEYLETFTYGGTALSYWTVPTYFNINNSYLNGYLENHPQGLYATLSNLDLETLSESGIDSDDMRLWGIDFDFMFYSPISGWNSNDYMRCVIRVEDSPSQDVIIWQTQGNSQAQNQWHSVSLRENDFGEAVLNKNLYGETIRFFFYNKDHHGGNYYFRIDNVKIMFNEVL